MIRRGDLILFMSYIPDGDGYQANGMDSKQPALFIGRTKQGCIPKQDNPSWCIPLSEAYRYVDASGYPTIYAWEVTAKIGDHIGLGDTYSVRRQIFTAIGTYIVDLVETMKNFDMVRVERHGLGKVYGEIVLSNHGEIVGGTEMRR